MLNRPPVEGLEFSLVTVVASVVPAAIRAAFIGSVISAFAGAAATFFDAARFWQWTAEFAGEIALAVLSVVAGLLFVGVPIGIAFCGFYLITIGVPLAWLLRERMGSYKSLVALLFTAPIAAYVASNVVGIGPMDWATHVESFAFLLACAYVIPAAIYFRHDIIAARKSSALVET